MAVSAKWGPFPGPHQASIKLAQFTDSILDPKVGIAWSSLGELMPFRQPAYDESGFGDLLVVEWNMNVPPMPPRAGAWGHFLDFMERAFTQIGQSKIDQAEAQQAADQAMMRGISTVFARMTDAKNRADGVGVALDVLCVGLSLATLATPVGWIGLAAFAGGATLLLADGATYGMELAGEDQAADKFKDQTQIVRICATVMTLPDLAWGGFKAVKEVSELRGLRASSLSTAARADADAVMSATRARQFAEIAERARQRAAARMATMKFKIAHDVTPRGLAPGGIYLLYDEVTSPEDRGPAARFLQQYGFHIVSTRKQ